jgi:hypothetical protein
VGSGENVLVSVARVALNRRMGPVNSWMKIAYVAAGLVFGTLEIRQHIGSRRAGAAEPAPEVEVLVLHTDADHAVDR